VKTFAVVAIIALSLACAREPQLRITQSGMSTVSQSDGHSRTTVTLHMDLPTRGRSYHLRDIRLTDGNGRIYTPTSIEVQHSSNTPDKVVATFAIDGDFELTELRVGEFRAELREGSRSGSR
jgi:hypothetical protein